jgi:hypothetical protein
MSSIMEDRMEPRKHAPGMKPHSILLGDETWRKLREEAWDRGVSISEIIRERLDGKRVDKVSAGEFREAVLPYPPTDSNAITVDPPEASEIRQDDSFGSARPAPKPVRKK